MSCGHVIPDERIAKLVLRALAAAADRDTDAIADATRPIFYEGNQLDGWLFLVGVFACIEKMLGGRPPRQIGLRLASLGSGGRLTVVEPEAAPPEIVAFGRLLTSYLNRDSSNSAALWLAAVHNDTAPAVMALALTHAADLIRAGAR